MSEGEWNCNCSLFRKRPPKCLSHASDAHLSVPCLIPTLCQYFVYDLPRLPVSAPRVSLLYIQEERFLQSVVCCNFLPPPLSVPPTIPSFLPSFLPSRRSSSQLFAAYSALSEEGTAAMVEGTLSQVADVSLPGERTHWALVPTCQRGLRCRDFSHCRADGQPITGY